MVHHAVNRTDSLSSNVLLQAALLPSGAKNRDCRCRIPLPAINHPSERGPVYKWFIATAGWRTVKLRTTTDGQNGLQRWMIHKLQGGETEIVIVSL
jgi:hypothetical protein